MTDDKPLRQQTIKRRGFVRDILKGKTIKKAYKDNIARGAVTEKTSEVNGSRELRNAETQAELRRQVEGLGRDWVQAKLRDLAEDKKINPNARVRAIELIGRTFADVFQQEVAQTNILNAINLDQIRGALAKQGDVNKLSTPSPDVIAQDIALDSTHSGGTADNSLLSDATEGEGATPVQPPMPPSN